MHFLEYVFQLAIEFVDHLGLVFVMLVDIFELFISLKVVLLHSVDFLEEFDDRLIDRVTLVLGNAGYLSSFVCKFCFVGLVVMVRVVACGRELYDLKSLSSQFGSTSFAVVNKLSVSFSHVLRPLARMIVTGSAAVDILLTKHLGLHLRRPWTFEIFPTIILLLGFGIIVPVLVLALHKRHLVVEVKVVIGNGGNSAVGR